jgi:hypothetical protein
MAEAIHRMFEEAAMPIQLVIAEVVGASHF